MGDSQSSLQLLIKVFNGQKQRVSERGFPASSIICDGDAAERG